MTRVLTVDPRHPHRERIHEAAVVLREGGLVAFPTETVYGLGANALNAAAVARIFEVKGRPSTDPVIVHLAVSRQLTRVARHLPSVAQDLADAFWPGALTLIVEKAPSIPDIVTAGLPTVGVRVPSHPIAHLLIEEAGVPVAAPSANRFSRPSPTRAEHVLADLGDAIDIVIDGGPAPIGVESTILDLTVTPPLVRRPGGVTLADLRRILPDVQGVSEALTGRETQLAPGQLTRHYAPNARLTLYVGGVEEVAKRLSADVRTAVASGIRVGVLAPEEDLRALAPRLAAIDQTSRVVTMRCGSRRDRLEAAHELYRVLRALDAEAVDVIFAASPTGTDIDAAIIDRLTRAAEGRVIRVSGDQAIE
jgi:L-threonylcarbamoyladenylate synthase